MKRIVIIGAGFGGLTAAKELLKSENKITIIDKTNHHLFQPLLYQVATAALSPGDIAEPIRSVFKNHKNIEVVLGTVNSIDVEEQKVHYNNSEIEFDYLILAPGSSHSYFGKDEWSKFAPGLKTLNDALKIREKILLSLEKAEMIEDENERKKYLSFVIVGGGPTGVELAGAIAEIVNNNVLPDFRRISSDSTKVYLVEAMSALLNSYPQKLTLRAKEDLEKLGVNVILNEKVTGINENGVQVENEFIETKNIIWAAGNKVSTLINQVTKNIDRSGRAIVNKDLSITENKNVFVIGDSAFVKDKKGNTLPAIAPVAIQQGKFVGKLLRLGSEKRSDKEFHYFDKGTMATIGKAKAVAVVKGFQLSGLFAWLAWCVIHIFYLISFRNRLRVMAEWAWYYLTNRPGIRLIVRDENQ
jgi:NADH:quinone reductase (non-electrogenic)